MLDFTGLMARAQQQGWALVALDCAVDTTTPAGEAMAHVLATFAQFERRLISQRTKDALAVKRAAGKRLGRPPTLPRAVERRIARERKAGRALTEIADRLNDDAWLPRRVGAGGIRPRFDTAWGVWRLRKLDRQVRSSEPAHVSRFAMHRPLCCGTHSGVGQYWDPPPAVPTLTGTAPARSRLGGRE
jgi:hypothetical protein